MKTLIVLLLLAVGTGLGYPAIRAAWRARHRPSWREAPVTRGDVTAVVNSTGTIQPVRRVQVGTFVSGPIIYLDPEADFNHDVKKDHVLAEIDPRIYEASVRRDEAALATAKAEWKRVWALLEQARKEEERAERLRKENAGYLSEAESDKLIYMRLSLEAQLDVAAAAIKQATANLKNSEATLDYTKIRAPEAGTIIDRKIDAGQTLAAQFQTPELFVVAPRMREEMYIFASVDEADVGLINDAKRRNQPVQFTVDAYPDDLFHGAIKELRPNPTTTQNVVTYPVVVSVKPNPEGKLWPGMTASLSFQIERHEKVLRVPNAALRFYPKPEQVRPEDRPILEGVEQPTASDEEARVAASQRSAADRVEAGRNRSRRHVWVADGEYLRAVEVMTGISDSKDTELISGELEEGQQLVTGAAPPRM